MTSVNILPMFQSLFLFIIVLKWIPLFLGFLVSFSHPKNQTFIKFYLFKLLANTMHQQFLNFRGTRSFRYQSHLSHMLIHQNYSHMGYFKSRMVNDQPSCCSPNHWVAAYGKRTCHQWRVFAVCKLFYVYIRLYYPQWSICYNYSFSQRVTTIPK